MVLRFGFRIKISMRTEHMFVVDIMRCAQTCTVCPGGELLRNGDALLSPDTAGEFSATTCGELETNDGFTGVDEDHCSFLQISVGVGQCGCDPPNGVCTVCSDGTPLVDPARVLNESQGNTTCQNVAATAAFVNASEDCSEFHFPWAIACGCDALTEGDCPLCGDYSVPENLDGVYIDDDFEITCTALASIADFVVVESGTCNYIQTLSTACGCPPVQVDGACSLCPLGEPAPNPSLEVFETTCANLALAAGQFTDDCGNVHLAGGLCGCETPPEGCALCAEGASTPIPNEFIDLGDLGPTTCGEYEQLVRFVASDTEI
jgi:hypothetical protein